MLNKLKTLFAVFLFVLGISASAVFIISIILFLLNLALPTPTLNFYIFAACNLFATIFFKALAQDAKLNSNQRHFKILHNTAFALNLFKLAHKIV